MGGGTATAVREKMESIPLETMAKSKPFQVVYNVMKEEAAKAGETVDDMELARRAREVVIDEAVNSGYFADGRNRFNDFWHTWPYVREGFGRSVGWAVMYLTS